MAQVERSAPSVEERPLRGRDALLAGDLIGAHTFERVYARGFLVLIVLAGSGIWMTLSILAFGLFVLSVNSLTQAAAIDVVGRGLEGTFIGLMWGSNAFFGALAAIFVGVLADVWNREVAFYFTSIVFALGFLVALAMPSTGGCRRSS